MKVAFFGTPEFAVPALDSIHEAGHEIVLVVAQPDRRSGRGMKLTPPPVAIRARELGLELEQPQSVRREEFASRLRAASPEIAVVVAYGRILPGELLEIPDHGFVNIHGSLLPSYRGAAPIQRAIENGDTVTGVTIMKIDEELDHGPVLLTAETPIGPDETSADLFRRLAGIGADAIVEALGLIDRGEAKWVEQDHTAATLAPMIDKREGITTFEEPARKIFDRWRAFQPWPGLATLHQDEAIKLKSISIHDRGVPEDARPGTVVEIGDDAMVVKCGEGALRVESGQRPGRGPVNGQELADALGLRSGDPLARESDE